MNHTGRASRALLPAGLTAVVLAVLVLFAPTPKVAGPTLTGADLAAGSATPITLDADAARWASLRQPRGIAAPATGLDQLPTGVLGAAFLAAIALLFFAFRPRVTNWVPRSPAYRLPGVRGPPVPAL